MTTTQMDVGVIVGRFQVHKLHEGHKILIQSVLDKHKKVLIFLGTSPIPATKKNPLDFLTRKQMLIEEFPTVSVLSIPDSYDDHKWSFNLDSRIREIILNDTVLLYGSRDSFIQYYHGKYPVFEIDQKIFISGTEIHQSLKNDIIGSDVFRAGVIYAVLQQYDRVCPTIDVAILRQNECLFGRKANEHLLRFIGGHADPVDSNYEHTVKRETFEETGVEIDHIEYVCSHRVEDWRYKNETDKIITVLYKANYIYGRPTPNDDIYELEWKDLRNITQNDLVHEHRFLLKRLLDNLRIGIDNESE
jgi:bifunctional NMN adenylyltransferase/nudix hydrolase